MPRRKKQNFDTKSGKETVEAVTNMMNDMMNDIKNQLSNIFPESKSTEPNIVEGFTSAANEEIENTALEYNTQSNPIILEKELVMAIYDIREGTKEYEHIDSYERDYRRIKELLKHDEMVKRILDRGIRKKDAENYIKFIKKIVGNPDYKKYLSKARKARASDRVAIPKGMLDDLLDLLDSMAENTEEKRLVKLRRDYMAELEEIVLSYQNTIEQLAQFTYFDIEIRLRKLKEYALDLKKINDKLYTDLRNIEEYASKKKEIDIKLMDSLYNE